MQKVYIFPGSINKIEEIISAISKNKIFLVRGKKSFEGTGLQNKISLLLNDLIVTEFFDFTVNPKIEEAKIGFEIFKKSGAEIIIAIGGGSVIDMAKIIKYLAISKQKKEISLIAIPTTAGTGSEATHFSVVYINGKKESYAHASLLPKFVIVDANLLKSQSVYQKTVSGLDAFAQSIESFWSIHSTKKSMEYSVKGMRLIWENLQEAIAGKEKALINVAKGSYFSGKAINITKTTAPHALSYGFTSLIGLPHGHAVSLFLPYFINLHKNLKEIECNDKNGADSVKDKIKKIGKILKIDSLDLDFAVLCFFRDLNICINFAKLNINEDLYFKALKGVSNERLMNNPAKVSEETLKAIFIFNNNLNSDTLI